MNVEIEITLRCTRACPQCNRYSNLFDFMPVDDTDMTLDQINRFCGQVEASGVRLGKVSVMGGEPLLHPEFEQIVDTLHKRLRKQSLVKEIILATNGDLLQGTHPRLLERVKTIVNWKKDKFTYVLAAPMELGQRQRRCPVPRRCGICLNVWGYWPCGPGASISRLFGFIEYQRMQLPKSESLTDFGSLDHLRNWPLLCGLCQWSACIPIQLNERDEPSKLYRDAIERYKEHPVCPTLERF